jgi:hypothetical protein
MHRTLIRSRFAIGALALAALAIGASAHAQATIDQKKALAGSVTPGDAAGFPVTLSVPGSYKLTGNLIVPAGLSGVEITASGVTLDLNGFNVSGPVTCTRDQATSAVTCISTFPTAIGVQLKAPGNTVRNGGVRGFYQGVHVLGGDQLDGLLIEHNYYNGVSASNHEGARTLIRNVRSQFNGFDGIGLPDALVTGSTAGGNGRHGFRLSRGVLLDSVAFANKGIGITGNNIAVGRSVAQGNKGGNIVSATSLGGNLNDAELF